jgi:hypothetical protein
MPILLTDTLYLLHPYFHTNITATAHCYSLPKLSTLTPATAAALHYSYSNHTIVLSCDRWPDVHLENRTDCLQHYPRTAAVAAHHSMRVAVAVAVAAVAAASHYLFCAS